MNIIMMASLGIFEHFVRIHAVSENFCHDD